jgi:hypothetical protein
LPSNDTWRNELVWKLALCLKQSNTIQEVQDFTCFRMLQWKFCLICPSVLETDKTWTIGPEQQRCWRKTRCDKCGRGGG